MIFPSFYHRPHEDQPLSWKYIQYFAVIHFPLVMTNSLLLNMAIEIVDLPIKNGDFHGFLYVYQTVHLNHISLNHIKAPLTAPKPIQVWA